MHAGGIEGFSSMYLRRADGGLTVIMLCNGGSIHQIETARQIAALYQPEFAPPRPPALQDPEPKTSAWLRQVTVELAQGNCDPEIMTPDLRRAMTPEAIRNLQTRFNALGPLNSFELVGLDKKTEGLSLRYQALFGRMPLLVRFVLNEDRKIAGLWVEPE